MGGRGQVSTLHLAAELLLAHGDPRARVTGTDWTKGKLPCRTSAEAASQPKHVHASIFAVIRACDETKLQSKNSRSGFILTRVLEPAAKDKDGKSVLDEVSCVELGTDESTRLLAQKPFLRELVALLAACSLQGVTEQGFADPAGLFRGLELLGEPKRSQIALGILGLAALRPIGPAELKWRNPGPGLEEQLAALDDELAAIKRLKETSQRRRALRRMLFEWHPDKNSHRHELAKAAFQHIQMQKADILEKGRAPKHATGPG